MPAQIVDLFCGIGGLTRGLINSGLNVIAGFDIDPTCQYTYEHNNEVEYHLQNIREVNGEEIVDLYDDDATRILVGCAPWHLVNLFHKCDLNWVTGITTMKNTICFYSMAG